MILISLTFLAFGFSIGFYSTNIAMAKIAKRNYRNFGKGGNTIMTRRMQAINQALKEGKDTYDFEVTGFRPILNK